MDYEKNNALAIVRQMIADGQIAENVAAKYFPELAESEDEKIRKHLITFFKDDYGENSNALFAGIKAKDIIAWLEKQGEHNDKHQYKSRPRYVGEHELLGAKCNWKPTSEQMKALKYILQKIPYEIHKQSIADLLEQLKAL